MWHVWGIEEVHIGLWWENPRERGNLEDPDVDGRIIVKWIFTLWPWNWAFKY